MEDGGSRKARAPSSTLHPPSSPSSPLRILTAVPICDGHDSAISTINLELIRGGMEVIYLGFHRSVRDIVRAAIQEDVRAIGLSSYNGGHVEFFSEVAAQLRKAGAGDVGLFGGGGGTIGAADAKLMMRRGVDRIFFAGTPLDEMVRFVRDRYAGPIPAAVPKRVSSDRELARALSAAAAGGAAGAIRPLSRYSGGGLGWGSESEISNLKSQIPEPPPRPSPGVPGEGESRPLVIGVTGPGGAGKTTLIDELVLRFLTADANARIAILSHDPSLADKGALLGDRAAMIHAQHDRVFMRSLATRGQSGGLSPGTLRCLRLLKEVAIEGYGSFDAIFVETVGIGQEAAPFAGGGRGGGLVDRTVFVMGADYGSRLQLQKIAMLDAADLVVVNKSDLAGARTAAAEIAQRLEANPRPARVIPTTAKRHRDGGVDELWNALRA